MTMAQKAVSLDGKMRRGAVVDGEIQYLSVSQITKFDPQQFAGCERKWWFRYVKRLPEPDEVQHVAGRDLHALIDEYLRTGVDTLSALARAGKHLMPEPGDDLLIETELGDLLTADGIPVVGRLDCAHRRGWYLDTEGELRPDPPNTIEIIDWKSTSDLKYAKSGSELAETIQMIGYAEWAARKYPDLEFARLSHVYFQKRGKPRAAKSTALFPLAFVRQRWQTVELTVKRMRTVAKCVYPEDVPANYASCDAYKGCAFRSVCPISREQRLAQAFGGRNMNSLLDRLNKQTTLSAPEQPNPAAPAAKPGGLLAALQAQTMPTTPSVHALAKEASAQNAAAAGVTVPAPTLAERKAALAKEVERLEAEEKQLKSGAAPITCACGDSFAPVHYETHKAGCKAAKAVDAFGGPEDRVVGTCPACGDTVTSATGSVTPSGRVVHTSGCKAAVNPPDAARSEGPVSAAPIPADVVLPPVIAAAAAPLQPPAQPAGKVPSDKPKRGRKSKAATASGNGPSAADQAPTAARVPVERIEPPAAVLGDAKPAAEDSGFLHASSVFNSGLVLLVDVRVEGLTVRSLDKYVAELCAALAAEHRAADIRCAPNDTPLGFGKWKGALAALVASNPPEPGVYVINDVRESEIKQVVVEALKPLASTFVRGVH